MNQSSQKNVEHDLAKYRLQQANFWCNLNTELEEYRNSYGATVKELTDGLEISRQRLYDFINKPENGLPINRG